MLSLQQIFHLQKQDSYFIGKGVSICLHIQNCDNQQNILTFWDINKSWTHFVLLIHMKIMGV